MATAVTIYLNNSSFTAATAVYMDVGLTTIAPDGWYSDGTNVRQQISGILQAAVACEGCGYPELLCYSTVSELDVCCNCSNPTP